MHKRTVAAALALVLVAVVLAPSAAAQTDPTHPKVVTPTRLYFHIFDVFNVFPINTQRPNTTYFEVGGTNFPTVAANQWDFNTIRGFSTSGPVEYDFDENGRPRFHPERGQAADVDIVGAETVPVNAFMYFEVRDFVGGDFPDVLPFFHVRVTVRSNNQYSQEAELDNGDLIMHGEAMAHLSSVPSSEALGGLDGTTGYETKVADANGVVEMVIPMTLDNQKITRANGYNVRVDWWQDASGTPDASDPADDQASEGFVRIASAGDYNNRLEFAIMNPIFIDYVHPEVAAGILLIHTAMNSPWGTYDVDVKNVTIEIFDDKGNPAEANLERVVSQGAHVHNAHDKPAEITWLWRYRQDKIPDGDYSIKVTVPNMACGAYPEGCAKAVAEAGFHLDGKNVYGTDETGQSVTIVATETDGAGSPNPGVILLLAAIAIAAMLRRRM